MVEYNKEDHKVNKPRALKRGSGPRDLQKRQNQSQNINPLVDELRRQISELNEKLNKQDDSRSNTNGDLYTAEELDTEINKVIDQVSNEMENKHAQIIKEQREEINNLNKKLEQAKEGNIDESVMSNEDINKAINDAVEEALSKREDEVNNLKEELQQTKNDLKIAEEKVVELKKELVESQDKITEHDKVKKSLDKTKALLKEEKNKDSGTDNIKKELEDIKKELNETKNALSVANSKLESKDELIQAKEDTINTLKDRPVNVQVSGISEGSTTNNTSKETVKENEADPPPEMETIFVDPTEEQEEVAPHLKFNDVQIQEQEEMSSKVDKLRSLMNKNKLPE